MPLGGAGVQTQYATTWDANVGALVSFLDGGNPLFLFNNNETNTDQNLAIWAKLWLTDSNGDLYGRYLYLSNEGRAYGSVPAPAQLSGDATLYNPGNLAAPAIGFDAGPPTSIPTDYVMSGGQVCLDADLPGNPVVACSSPTADETFNHNLGANQVAYVAEVPLLNTYLQQLVTAGANLNQYSMHLELWLGCDPRISQVTCANLKIDNGYE